MTAKSLDGRVALVTRAAHQNSRLCEQLSMRGARAIAVPCVGIDFAGAPHPSLIEDLQWCDGAVFTSANAVAGVSRLCGERALLSAKALWTVGAASKRALAEWLATGQALEAPDKRAGAAGLLALDSMRDIAGRRILVVRGEPSLANIGPTLIERQADVREAIVYRSRALQPSLSDALGQLRWQDIDAVLISSLSALEGITQAIGQPPWQALAANALLVAASARLARLASERGWAIVVDSASPEDDGLLACLEARLAPD